MHKCPYYNFIAGECDYGGHPPLSSDAVLGEVIEAINKINELLNDLNIDDDFDKRDVEQCVYANNNLIDKIKALIISA